MKKTIVSLLDWFEEHFNYLIELLAFVGGVFCILFAIFLFIALLFFQSLLQSDYLGYILIPGIIGFFGVLILLILRITRYLMTHKED